jgi:hypothetical protein
VLAMPGGHTGTIRGRRNTSCLMVPFTPDKILWSISCAWDLTRGFATNFPPPTGLNLNQGKGPVGSLAVVLIRC